MEILSNLAWLFVALSVLTAIYWNVRRGKVGISAGKAMLLAFLICVLLFPLISVSDDLLSAQQVALPLPAQTWRMASEGTSLGLEIESILSAGLLVLLAYLVLASRITEEGEWDKRPQSVWLTRSLRLRPPPAIAL